MNTTTPAPTAATLRTPRPLYWSIRRELWENRSIVIAPVVSACVVILAFLVSVRHLPDAMLALLALDPERQHEIIGKPVGFAMVPILVTSLLIAVFYCLDALHGERRDRSILFWKSLPVSDTTAVLAKMGIPLVVLPAIVFVITAVLYAIMLAVSAAVLGGHGVETATLWSQVALFERLAVLFYGLVALALWYAPVYAWLLLVSGAARRMTFLWAVLPPLGLMLAEKIAFGTGFFALLFKSRLSGVAAVAFRPGNRDGVAMDRLSQIDPVGLLTSPGLWIGLLVAAALLFAAIRLRRYQQPI